MTRRVECRDCHIHRDLAVMPQCPCGCADYTDVRPTVGDLRAADERTTAELVECAELIDVAVRRGEWLDSDHPLMVRLSSACRDRALFAAGITWSPRQN